MKIDEEINVIDCQIRLLKLELNSNYGISLNDFLFIYEKVTYLRAQKYMLLKKKERRLKLAQINESR